MADVHPDQFANFPHAWDTGPSTPVPGSARHPQGRLFNPGGMYTGDPWKLSPENWMKGSGTPAHNDIITWHGSESSQLPRYDMPDMRQVDPYEHEGADWGNEEIDPETGEYNDDYVDYSVDTKDRPMADYGSAVGMHFGSPNAAISRGETSSPRPFLHAVRLPESTLAPPPRGGFSTPRPGGSIAGGDYRSGNLIVNKETGERTKDTRWSDAAANFATKATDLVESGHSIAYRNDVEAKGSTSYRTLPETVRTWSEDVLGATSPRTGRPSTPGEQADVASGFRNEPHPGLVHLARAGYNPQVRPGVDFSRPDDVTLKFASGREEDVPGAEIGGVGTPEYRRRTDAFEAGQLFTMRKPTPEHAW